MGIFLGLANYFLQRRALANVDSPVDNESVSPCKWLILFGLIAGLVGLVAFFLQHVTLARMLVWVVVAIVLTIYAYYMRQEFRGPGSLNERRHTLVKMGVAIFLMLEAVVFFVLYHQMPTSLNLFAVHNVHPNLFGFPIDPQSFQVLNPIWIVLLCPILAAGYAELSNRGVAMTIPYKFALGMTCCGISFSLLYFARFAHDATGMVSSGWLVASYLFQSAGELLVSALGVAMVAELVPRRMTGFVMGTWFLTSSVSGVIGASVASYAALPRNLQPGIESLMIYTEVFAHIGLITLGIAAVLWLLAPRLNALIR